MDIQDPVNTPDAYTFPDGTKEDTVDLVIYDNPYWSVNNN